MSTLQAVALTVLPNLGGIIGALVNNPQIDTWYKVSANIAKVKTILLVNNIYLFTLCILEH